MKSIPVSISSRSCPTASSRSLAVAFGPSAGGPDPAGLHPSVRGRVDLSATRAPAWWVTLVPDYGVRKGTNTGSSFTRRAGTRHR